jgi:hypothetical protein
VDPQVMLAELAKLGVVIKERKQTKRLLSF